MKYQRRCCRLYSRCLRRLYRSIKSATASLLVVSVYKTTAYLILCLSPFGGALGFLMLPPFYSGVYLPCGRFSH